MAPENLTDIVESLQLKGPEIPQERFDAKNYAITNNSGEYGCDCGACDNGGYCMDC